MRKLLRRLIPIENRTAIMAVCDNCKLIFKSSLRFSHDLTNIESYQKVYSDENSELNQFDRQLICKLNGRFVKLSLGEIIDEFARQHLSFLDSAPTHRVLEIGAGGGSVILRLAKIRPGIEFVGIEPTLNGCKLIQDQADRLGLTNVSVIQALGQDDVSDLGQFDFIYSNLCLEQIADKDVVTAILRNIRLTSSSGRCSFMEPWLDGNNYLQRKYLRFQGYLNAHSSVLRDLGFLNITSINSVVHHNPRFRVSHVTCSDL